MARGKHKARATNQRSINNDVILEQLRTELEMESTALSEAEDTLKRITLLQSDLAADNVALVEEVAPYAGRLRQERDFLRAVFADVRSHHARIHDTWQQYTSSGFDRAPGATKLEQVESLQQTMGLNGYLGDEPHLKVKNRSTEAITRLQRARGERRNVAESSTPEQRQAGTLGTLLDMEKVGDAMIRSGYRQLLLDQNILFLDDAGTHHIRDATELTTDQNTLRTEALNVAEKIWDSRSGDLDADGVLVWGTGNIVSTNNPPGNSRLALGFTAETSGEQPPLSAGITTGIPLPLANTPETSRNMLARQSAEGPLAAWRGVFESRRLVAKNLGLPSHPFAPLAHHPHPGQGLALQNAYALAAFSRWIDEGRGSAYAQAAIGITAAATYWLPAGQTASFAESEPMDESDRAEMILPFPQVFLAFAEPMVLEPTIGAVAQTEEKWRVLSAITHDLYRGNGSAGSGINDRVRRAGGLIALPTIDEILSERGAHIEGILLLSDSLGRPADRFGWCLTIPGAYGSTLGRFVVPALRSATEYRDVVDNLTAVVAWAQWHEPDQSTEVPLGVSIGDLEGYVSSTDFRRNAKRAGAGIRVVDVRSTHRGAGPRPSRVIGEPDVSVSPHIRKGHWRRQRFGRGLEQFKRIRIAPVLVNAHRGDIVHRVYRLRRSAKIVER
jgi:hypothetical protein